MIDKGDIKMDDYEDEPSEDDFDDEEYNDGEENEVEDFEDDPLEDDPDEEAEDDGENNEDEEGEKDWGIWKSHVTKSKTGHCRFCDAEVILDELPDSISRDAFEQFGICLNCQWGIFMGNGGHF